MVIPYKPGRCITDEKKQVAIFCRLHLFYNLNKTDHFFSVTRLLYVLIALLPCTNNHIPF